MIVGNVSSPHGSGTYSVSASSLGLHAILQSASSKNADVLVFALECQSSACMDISRIDCDLLYRIRCMYVPLKHHGIGLIITNGLLEYIYAGGVFLVRHVTSMRPTTYAHVLSRSSLLFHRPRRLIILSHVSGPI